MGHFTINFNEHTSILSRGLRTLTIGLGTTFRWHRPLFKKHRILQRRPRAKLHISRYTFNMTLKLARPWTLERTLQMKQQTIIVSCPIQLWYTKTKYNYFTLILPEHKVQHMHTRHEPVRRIGHWVQHTQSYGARRGQMVHDVQAERRLAVVLVLLVLVTLDWSKNSTSR